MKYIKLFEQHKSHEEIDEICRSYNIRNYTINSDGTIDVDGGVNLFDMGLTKLPLKFNKVSGNFSCSKNKLTSLEGCPKSVGGNFRCTYNELTSLEFCPKSVGGDFYCSDNKLTSLEGCPKSVGGSFNCVNNKLTSLEFAPKSIGGDFYCSFNKVVDFNGIENCGELYCSNNPVYEVWILFEDVNKIELFNDTDIIQDGIIILDRLNWFLEECGQPTFTEVKGYKCI